MPYSVLVCNDCEMSVPTPQEHGPEDEYCEGESGYERIDVFTEHEIKYRFAAVLSDDEAMRRARAAFLAGPPHGIKHSDADRLEHMRNAIRAAFGSSPVFRERRRYACGVDAEAEVTCDRCPDPDGCIDRSYHKGTT